MKKAIIFLAAVIISFTSFSQVNFSGTWQLNTSKSKLGGEFTMSPKEVVIKQSGNEMTVEKHSEFQGQEFTMNSKYTLDGKECVNTGFMDSNQKSTAVWSDDKKSLKITTKFTMGDMGEEMVITELYSLSGSNLSVEMSSASSFGEMSETGVYDKK
ncbi:MAG: hypothetical protein JXR31_07920 [Prolixibacteraceae bacterium]|nr:hypothetical protein [Prolixibacteraceae bacterium]MBN2774160.1 hypothetical protein [Prolixibacteraceae bacterium]